MYQNSIQLLNGEVMYTNFVWHISFCEKQFCEKRRRQDFICSHARGELMESVVLSKCRNKNKTKKV